MGLHSIHFLMGLHSVHFLIDLPIFGWAGARATRYACAVHRSAVLVFPVPRTPATRQAGCRLRVELGACQGAASNISCIKDYQTIHNMDYSLTLDTKRGRQSYEQL